MPLNEDAEHRPMSNQPNPSHLVLPERRPVGGTVGMVGMVVIFALATAAVVAGCNPFGSTPATTVPPDRRTPNAIVTYVIDGDTISVDIDGTEEHVRLIGIDTPEIEHAESTAPAECYGPEATEYTRSLLPEGTSIHLQRDVEARDDYGRLLGYVYRAEDGVFVNYEIVRNGFAEPLSIAPNTTYATLFADAATEAHRSDVGLWGAC